MKFERFVLICATGRSGSTTLMRILNTIPNSNICGENWGAVNDLLRFYRNLKKTVEYTPGTRKPLTLDACEKQKIKPCFYNSFDYVDTINKLRSIIISMFKNGPNQKFYGFKEIRYYGDNIDLIDEFLELFPNTKIIIHIRKDTINQSKSSWFAENKNSKNFLDGYNNNLIKYYQKHNKNRVYLSEFENLFDIEELQKIFSFLECEKDFNYIKIKKILDSNLS